MTGGPSGPHNAGMHMTDGPGRHAAAHACGLGAGPLTPLVAIVLVMVAALALREIASLVVPVLFGLFLALVAWPLVGRLEARGSRHAVALTATLLVVLAIVLVVASSSRSRSPSSCSRSRATRTASGRSSRPPRRCSRGSASPSIPRRSRRSSR